MMAVVVAGSMTGSSKDEQTLARTVRILKERGITHVAVASRIATAPQAGVGLISFSERFPLGTAVSEYARSFESTRVMLVPFQGADLSGFGEAVQSLVDGDHQAAFEYAPVNEGSIPLEFPGASDEGAIAQNILQGLQPGIMVPAGVISCSIGTLLDSQTNSQSLPGLALELFLETQSSGEETLQGSSAITMVSNAEAFSPSNSDIAAAVRKAIESFAIEDLYPSLPWSTDERESGASAYHSLGAKFIRLGDLASAESCVARAEDLVESPRSLALRAVIAMEKGETFGAIAKLIASLQEYEQGSKSVKTSVSQNVEHVNLELKKGLEALNAQNSNGALKHFARAIREFDGFYRETGLLQRI